MALEAGDGQGHGEYVAVRLEGGLGDHVLGMRVLPFVRARHPGRRLVLLSDAGGQPAQLAVAALAPGNPVVIPIARKPDLPNVVRKTGSLDHLDAEAAAVIAGAAAFVDTHGETMFVEAARVLDYPVFDILATVPRLELPATARAEADALLRRSGGERFVAMNLTKYGAAFLQYGCSMIDPFVEACLAQPGTRILNVFTPGYDFRHWTEPARTRRRRIAAEEYARLQDYRRGDERIVACMDLPIATVAALFERCRYFLGVDNGIKHLAWACRVPHTCLFPRAPGVRHVLRWEPDINQVLTFESGAAELARHVSRAVQALKD